MDFKRHELRVQRPITRGRLDTLKSGHGRTVDMSVQLAAVLQKLQDSEIVNALDDRGSKTVARGV